MDTKTVKGDFSSGRTLVMGDLHGSHLALKQCLERCGFDHGNDTLIQLGDVADGRDGVYQCVEELLEIENLMQSLGTMTSGFGNSSRPISILIIGTMEERIPLCPTFGVPGAMVSVFLREAAIRLP
ncbi:metallophosphoesterase [Sphingobacterium chuzhouense]|uniref:metallophosphoesterase n=1 Tax=Sphingobacterium chuzhouense TaxID=1742264 RepID=UPI001CC1CEA1|nr:metallophosphoesterase [Sphingobacterium chuzhouense]